MLEKFSIQLLRFFLVIYVLMVIKFIGLCYLLKKDKSKNWRDNNADE